MYDYIRNGGNITELDIEILDPVGSVLETWLIKVDGIKSINFGKCDYKEDNINIITLIFKPIDCILTNF